MNLLLTEITHRNDENFNFLTSPYIGMTLFHVILYSLDTVMLRFDSFPSHRIIAFLNFYNPFVIVVSGLRLIFRVSFVHCPRIRSLAQTYSHLISAHNSIGLGTEHFTASLDLTCQSILSG